MTTDSTTDIAPPCAPASWLGSLLRFSGPLIVLGIVGWINGIGAWPAFRQQDTSLLHWNLASNSEALKGLSQDIRSEGADWGNDLRHHLRNYLTLENMNLSGLDLSSSDLSDMSLENVSLAGTRLVNADFSCTDLSGVDFSGAKLMNSRLDYSGCSHHVSTTDAQCSSNTQKIIKAELTAGNWPFHPSNHNGRKIIKYACLEVTIVGADLSKAQIRGDQGRASLNDPNHHCDQLLVLVGNMSGAVFNEANLTCVALIHQPGSAAPGSVAKAAGENPDPISFNGISFTGARLDRVSLLKGPFRFSQFERANLMGLFLNIGVGKTDLDYSRFNEINCTAPSMMEAKYSKEQLKDKTQYRPCLLVQRGKSDNNPTLHLNLLWSTLVTNLKPVDKDSFLCTPKQDLPAWVEQRRVERAGYWLTPDTWPNEKSQLKLLNCPAPNPERPEQAHHLLSSSQSGGKLPNQTKPRQ